MNNSFIQKTPPIIDGTLRKTALRVPEAIKQCSGITIFGKHLKSIVFTTDVSIIRNVNADAVLAVYPFTPQPIISESILMAADIPVFAGVGGGLTTGKRVIQMAMQAEMQGAIGVVLNAPTSNEVILNVSEMVDIPIVISIVQENEDIDARVNSGAKIFNVSAAAKTPEIVRAIRRKYPDFPIIATGGNNEESILETIEAGANSITWTPPSNSEIFKEIMSAYRKGLPHP